MKPPLEALEHHVKQQALRLDNSSQKLSKNMNSIHKLHVLNSWKVFMASLFLFCASIGYSIYAIRQARTEVVRQDWVKQVNAAIAKGSINHCNDGALCALVNGKSHRLEQ